MYKYQVTIAIPLYNAQEYISTTLESALNQTYQDIEFLIIDDASEDKSLHTVEEITAKSSRRKDIRIIKNKTNSGISFVRNKAIENASGKYLFFLDSDDLIAPDCIMLLYTAIEKNQSEIALASHKNFDEFTLKEKEYQLPYLEGNQSDYFASLRFGALHQCIGFYIWNILYKMNFLLEYNLKFKDFRIGEDIVFLYDFVPLVQSFVLLPNITYTYRKRTKSLSRHGKRKVIPLEEVKEQIAIRMYGKQKIRTLLHKPYLPDMVTNQMKYFLEAASFIISKTENNQLRINDSQLKELIVHPLSIKEILQMDKFVLTNIFLYIWTHFPFVITKFSLVIFLRILKLSWKLKK